MSNIQISVDKSLTEGIEFSTVRRGDILKLEGPHQHAVYVYVRQDWTARCGNLTTIRLDDTDTRYLSESDFHNGRIVKRVKGRFVVSE